MSSPFQLESQITQIKEFFSSYLTDATAVTRNIREIVYEIIGIDLHRGGTEVVQPQMMSILVACKQSYEDLRRVESLLRGHLRAKKCQRSQSTHSRLIQREQIDNFYPDFPLTTQLASAFKPAPEGNVQSRTTVMSTLTDEQLKNNQTQDRLGATVETLIFRKDDQTRRDAQGNNRSVQLLKKIETLRDSRMEQMEHFELNNKECLGIIQKLKIELRSRQCKKLKKLRRK